ncbi:MAG: peptidylprolyl isomerase [Chloroflexaceae bacterium]|nr:peptidylprolyl isomerase [Chloroflexaceae bacterium]
MKPISWISGVALLVLLLLSACQSTDNGAALENTPEDSPTAFRVGDTVVTEAEFEQRLAEIIDQLSAQGQTEPQIAALFQEMDVPQQVFDQMIQEELLLQIAQQEGIGVNPEDVDAEVARRQNPLGTAPGDETTPDAEADTELRADIARELLIFETIARHTTTDMFRSRHILVEDEKTAEELLARIEDGEDFGELAAEYSQDPGSAQNGGEYDWTSRGSFVPEYEAVAFGDDAQLNTPTIIQSDFGFHIVEILEIDEGRAFENFNELRSSQNAQQAYEATFVPWYEGVRAEAEANGDLEVMLDPTTIDLPFAEDLPPPPGPTEPEDAAEPAETSEEDEPAEPTETSEGDEPAEPTEEPTAETAP